MMENRNLRMLSCMATNYFPFTAFIRDYRQNSRSFCYLLIVIVGLLGQNSYQAILLSKPLYAADCSTSLRDLTTVMSRYNVITLDDLSTTSSIEGRTFVGDDLISTPSATFASGLRRHDPTDPTLVVVDEIVAGNPLNLNAGSLLLGGNDNNRIINYNGGGSLTQDPTLANLAMIEIVESGSAELALLNANNVATIPVAQPSAARFDVDNGQGRVPAVFHIDGGDLFENPLVQQIELIPHQAQTIVINVAGTTIDWQYGNMIGNFVNQNWRGNLIWNFYEATAISLNGNNFMGALLAPYADVTSSGTIDGSVAARTLTTTGPVNLPSYEGNASAACPIVPLADLVVSKYSIPNPVVAGAPLLYTIVVSNNGPQDAENVIVTDELPAGVTFRTASPACEFLAPTVTCRVDRIAVDSQAIITVLVDVDATSADINEP